MKFIDKLGSFLPSNKRQANTPQAQRDEPRPLPVLGKLPIRSQYLALGLGVLVCGLAGVFISGVSLARVGQLTARVESSIEIQMLSQRLSKDIQKAQAGDQKAANSAAQDRAQVSGLLRAYKSGNGQLSALEDGLQASILRPMESTWAIVERSMDTLRKAQGDIAKLADNADDMDARSVGFKDTLDIAYLLMMQRGEYEGRVSAVQSLGGAINGLSKNMALASRSSKVDLRTSSTLNAGYLEVKSLLEALIKGSKSFNFGPVTDPEVLSLLKQVQRDSAEYLDSVNAAAKAGKTLSEGKAAATAALAPLDVLFAKAGELRKASSDEFGYQDTLKMASRVLFILAGLLLGLLALANSRDAARRAWFANNERQETDNAVIALITGLGPVSSGDLTARLPVTEHVTGSIADSVNATLDQLQEALQEVKGVSRETGNLVGSIKSLSSQTQAAIGEASDVARESRDLSQQGAGLVVEAVSKMDAVREKIQDVSKRVKRLGEVSQAIGRITGIIENVTEKTAILAMNTSLKAEESGEAGKPFRVIADEIRKLSDSTLKSLDEIGEAVKSIQSETNTVIKTVEAMTTDVVDGSKLWDEANVSLKLITGASNNIEQLVDAVSGYSAQQAEATVAASHLMVKLQAKADEFTTHK